MTTKAVNLMVAEIGKNGGVKNHEVHINYWLRQSKNSLCIVAFGKISGFKKIRENLEKSLSNGAIARFIFGLSFYHTEPTLLEELLILKRKYPKLSIYISQDSLAFTFHPKVYLFETEAGQIAIVGSANMTAGGLSDNYEVSLVIKNFDTSLVKDLENIVASWIDNKVIVLADEENVRCYSEKYNIYKAQQALANHRAKQQIRNRQKAMSTKRSGVNDAQINILEDYLREMRRDTSSNNFDSQCKSRLISHKRASQALKQLSVEQHSDSINFLKDYERLIQNWHSGGLHRGKTRITQYRKKFYTAIESLDKVGDASHERAFEILRDRFEKVKGVGTNVITEILHTLNWEKFPVMNQNSVHGVSLVYRGRFPDKPNKHNMDGAGYKDFYDCASTLLGKLKLQNFSELDALFNYVYWLQKQSS